MNRTLKFTALLSGAAVMCLSGFWFGKRQNDSRSFERGLELGKQRAAMFRGVDSYLFVKISDTGRTESLRVNLEEGMWMSIPGLDKLLKNPDASDEDRRQAEHVMPMLIEYYYLNPKTIRLPRMESTADAVEQALDKKSRSSDAVAEKESLDAVREAARSPMKEMDGIFDGMLDAAYKNDLEIQQIVERHIARRNFPGDRRSVGGITIVMPPDSGGGSGSSDRFHWKGKKMRVIYESGALRVNEQNFGTVSKGDSVDLRMIGRVFVNDVERFPVSP